VTAEPGNPRHAWLPEVLVVLWNAFCLGVPAYLWQTASVERAIGQAVVTVFIAGPALAFALIANAAAWYAMRPFGRPSLIPVLTIATAALLLLWAWAVATAQ
jgi:hypothetical protein